LAAAFSLVGRRPASGRGLDVYADQTLLDAIWGRAGRVPNAPPDSPKECRFACETLSEHLECPGPDGF